jgi:4-amino-4-deoxy-L-arabinose transferase-like glycosyltransferase
VIPHKLDIPLRGTALLLAALASLLFLHLGSIPLVGPDEPRYARVAVEMSRSGDLLTPTLQGHPWFEKPILYYWTAAASMRVFGESESAARLPSAVACMAWALLAVWLGTRLHSPSAGLHAGFILGMNFLGFIFGRAAAMDMLLTVCVSGAIGLFGLSLLGRAGRAATVTAYVLAGLAVLAKGPLGAVLPALVVGAYLALSRDREALRRVWSWPGVGLFLAISVPWYASMTLLHGRAFLKVFFLNHNLSRFFSTIHQHPGPLYYYIPILLCSLFPWSGLAVAALIRLAPRREPVDRLLLIWLLAPLVFFSAAGSKLPGYVLPCLPPLALLAGRLAAECAAEPARHVRELRLAAVLTVVVGLCVTVTPLIVWQRVVSLWPLLVPGALCILATAALFAWRATRDPAGALRIAQTGAICSLAILTLAAPTVLGRLESGHDLFALAQHEEVVVWGARRSVWMSGYFYNDGRVRQVYTFEQLMHELALGPRLVLCGPQERPRLDQPALAVSPVASGPRDTSLVRLARRPSSPEVIPAS